MKKILLGFSILYLSLMSTAAVFGAVGCDLNDPDRDVRKLFPESTGYKTIYLSVDKIGGKQLFADIEKRLGDKFNGIYETIGVPYTLYEIRKGITIIGYIHGVNQKGVYGGIQVFLALDTQGVIKAIYVQKLTSKLAAQLRSQAFGDKFSGLSLKDFYAYDVVSAGFKPNAPPALKDVNFKEADIRAVMRAVKKNLILMDEFVYREKYKQYFK